MEITEQKATRPPGIPSYSYTDYRNPTYHIGSLVGYLIGVEKQNSSMVTSVMLGEFRDNAATRSEFLSLIR